MPIWDCKALHVQDMRLMCLQKLLGKPLSLATYMFNHCIKLCMCLLETLLGSINLMLSWPLVDIPFDQGTIHFQALQILDACQEGQI